VFSVSKEEWKIRWAQALDILWFTGILVVFSVSKEEWYMQMLGLCKDKVSASYPIQKSLTPFIRWK